MDGKLMERELQLSTIAQMLYLELKRQGIPLAEDTEDRSNIIFSGAESILYGCNPNDITEVVEEIKQWISETKSNYPRYFITGECW